jgi:hypothetical protein
VSHITKIKIEVRSLPALIRAAQACGLEFREGQKTHKWYGRFLGDYKSDIPREQMGNCDHALGIPGKPTAYEVGIKLQDNGSYSLMWDFFEGGYGLQDAIGENGARLISEYAIEAASEAAQAQGWPIERQADKLIIYHPDGGTITVLADGSVDASQFSGTGCSLATAQIEQALGVSVDVHYKPEYLQESAQVRERGE